MIIIDKYDDVVSLENYLKERESGGERGESEGKKLPFTTLCVFSSCLLYILHIPDIKTDGKMLA